MYLALVPLELIGLGTLGLRRAELNFTIKNIQASKHPCGAPAGRGFGSVMTFVTEDQNSVLEEGNYDSQ